MPRTAPLAAVSPLPAPSPAPSGLIASVTPTGDASTTSQILVRFTGDVIPLQSLETPDENAILAHFAIEPALPGRFRFLTPRMIGFEADAAWPPATRVRVTVTKGLRDLRGRALADDLAWTFQTPEIEIAGLPGQKSADGSNADDEDQNAPVTLHPTISLTSNVALDVQSLAAHASLRPRGVRERDADPARRAAEHRVADGRRRPRSPRCSSTLRSSRGSTRSSRTSDLTKGTQYDITIAAGVAPRDGNVPTSYDARRRRHDVLGSCVSPACSTTRARSRFTSGQPTLVFTTPIDPKSIGAITLSPAPSKGSTPFAALGDNRVAVNTSLLAPRTTYTVAVGPGVADTFGQKLGRADSATIRTGDLSPDVWAPDGLNLFPSSRDVRLNVIAVNAPPVRATFRALQARRRRAERRPVAVRDARRSWARVAHGLRSTRAAPQNVERTIEVPLRAKLGAPAGALAYGVTAQLPGRHDPFVAAGVVQLTNLGVFAQFFPDDGLVRVNRISDGTPVARRARRGLSLASRRRHEVRRRTHAPRRPPTPRASRASRRRRSRAAPRPTRATTRHRRSSRSYATAPTGRTCARTTAPAATPATS